MTTNNKIKIIRKYLNLGNENKCNSNEYNMWAQANKSQMELFIFTNMHKLLFIDHEFIGPIFKNTSTAFLKNIVLDKSDWFGTLELLYNKILKALDK